MDHNVPTDDGPVSDPLAHAQLEALRTNCAEFGVPLYATGSGREGIVHVISPELGLTQPGATIVCGDSHTSTHGALGALAFGIGTSEVEHVLATQCLPRLRPRTMRILYRGDLPLGVTPKDVILGTIGRIGVDGAAGHVLEYAGEAIRSMSMEGRLTVCNMSIEAGARAGLIAPDETTFAYLEGRPASPTGSDWERALERWRELRTDDDAVFDREIEIDVTELEPQVTWGTNPAMVVPVGGVRPRPCRVRRRRRARLGRASAQLHGARGRNAAARRRDRPRLRRLVHERAHRGPPHRGLGRRRKARAPARPRDGRARLGGGEAARPRPKGSTASSRLRDSSGAVPDARCVSA